MHRSDARCRTGPTQQAWDLNAGWMSWIGWDSDAA
jgi:hypothetical protein